jgi:Mg2+/Co2+ transporter CorB
MLTGILIGFCLALASFITLLKTAFLRVAAADLLDAGERNPAQAKLLHALIRYQDSVLGTLQMAYVFIVMVMIIILAHGFLLTGSTLLLAVSALGLFVALVLLTYALPRSYMLMQPVEFSLAMAKPIRWCYYLFLPLSAAVNFLSVQITQIFKNHFAARPQLFQVADFQNLLTRDEKPDQQQQRLIQQNMERFSDLTIQEIMLPLSALETLDGDLPMEELLEKIVASHEQRLMVYQDTPENVMGILHVNLMLKAIALAEGDINAIDIGAVISEPVFASPFARVIDQIGEFQAHGQHFALVRNRQGQLKGAISLEGLVENLAATLRG